VEPWAQETAFADARRAILFDELSLQQFNRDFEAFNVQKVRKRAWMALPDTAALLDVDIALQLAPRSNRGIVYPRGGELSLTDIEQVVKRASALSVRVKTNEGAPSSTRLLNAGKSLAARIADQTSSSSSTAKLLVYPGKTTAVLEAPGFALSDVESARTHELSVGGIGLVSFDARVEGGGDVRCHVLWDPSGNKGNRKLIRELRIHILRLHSIHQLMHRLASGAVTSESANISDVPGTVGFDALQRTLLSCVRTIQTRSRPGGADSKTVLDTAFFAENFSEPNLSTALERTVSAMRPKVRAEVVAFVKAEEQRMRENATEEQERQRRHETAINIGEFTLHNQYVINGGNIGAVGDNARAEGSVFNAPAALITIGDQEVSRADLLAELGTLRADLSAGDQEGADTAAEAIQAAEVALQDGEDAAAIRYLGKLARWTVSASTAIGVSVAAVAIRAALGMN